MYNKEALRKELEDCWDAAARKCYDEAYGRVPSLHLNRPNYITSQLSAMSEAEGEKVGKLIARLLELKPYHMMPYNLGDMGEMGQIIDKLQKLVLPPSPTDEGQPKNEK